MKRKSRNMMKSVISLVLTVALVLGVVPLPFVPVIREVHAEGNVTYLDAEGHEQTAVNPTELTSQAGGITLGGYGETTWYVVNGNVSFSDCIYIKGNVNLILSDGAVLTVDNIGDSFNSRGGLYLARFFVDDL